MPHAAPPAVRPTIESARSRIASTRPRAALVAASPSTSTPAGSPSPLPVAPAAAAGDGLGSSGVEPSAKTSPPLHRLHPSAWRASFLVISLSRW